MTDPLLPVPAERRSRRRHTRGLVVVALLAALAVVPAQSAVAGAGAGSLTLVSGPSPYAGCTVGATSSSTNYLNAEVEPWLSVNPTTVGTSKVNLIGAWQQDRWSDGGAHGLVAGYSFNGGKTWGETPLPFSACANGGLSYERASDPWVSFGPDGTAYTVSISFNASNNDNAVAAATSTDGGKTWGNVTVLKSDIGTTQYFNDKESVTADPVAAGVAYAIWDRLASPNANPYADLHAFAYTGPTWFSKTRDYGKTWSTPVIINNVSNPTGEMNQTIGNQIVVDPRNGTLYDIFDAINSTGANSSAQHGYNVAFQKSTDGGATWSTPQTIAQLESVGVSAPNTGAALRTGDIIPEAAIDPASGALYVTWQDSRFNGGKYDEVALSSSSNGGATWTAPIRVNTPTGKAAFNPSIQVNASGTVAVGYYDFRTLTTQTSTLPTTCWLTRSTDGGATFGNEVQLGGTFDMMTAPYAEGYFVGDYQGLGAVGTTFQPFLVQTNSGSTTNPTDVFTAPLS